MPVAERSVCGCGRAFSTKTKLVIHRRECDAPSDAAARIRERNLAFMDAMARRLDATPMSERPRARGGVVLLPGRLH